MAPLFRQFEPMLGTLNPATQVLSCRPSLEIPLASLCRKH